MGRVAGKRDFELSGGGTWTEEMYYKTKSTGQPIDLTKWHGRMQLRELVTSAVIDVEITTANGRMVITPHLGQINIEVDASITQNLVKGNAKTEYVYGLELFMVEEGIEKVIPLLTGKVVVHPEVVRDGLVDE